MNKSMRLIPIERHGDVPEYLDALPEAAREVCRAAATMYDKVGYAEPWVCYLAILDDAVVGSCGFKGPPSDGRVEIAYFTFPTCEGRGIATAMATRLLTLALGQSPRPVVAAQTLPRRNASHGILEKLGFRHVATLRHPEDGTVWEWRLPAPLKP